MARKPRQPSAEEKALWSEVVRHDTPLKKPSSGSAKPRQAKPKAPRLAVAPIPEFQVGSRAETAIPRADLARGLTDRLEAAPLRMDHKAHRRLKSGKTKPEGRIDLHGMTADRAHGALTAFIRASRDRGLRTVLVITGKGRRDPGDDPIPRPHGVLRHEVPRWLSIPPLSALVLQVVPAHRRHGGSGAYYVHLSRAR